MSSRSRCTIFTMTPFDGKIQNLQMSLDIFFCASSYSFRNLTILNYWRLERGSLRTNFENIFSKIVNNGELLTMNFEYSASRWIKATHTCACTHTHTHTHTHTNTHTHTHTHAHKHTYTRSHTHRHTSIHMHAHTHIINVRKLHVHTHRHSYTLIYIYIYIYI